MSSDSAQPSPSQTLVDALARSFIEQVDRSLGFTLDYSPESLAFVDHHLRQLDDETPEPIVTLVCNGAGAYFGELVRRRLGALWIGDATDPRRLRLLLTAHFVHFSPLDQALEAVFSGAPEADDPRVAEGVHPDGSFQLRRTPADDAPDDESDESWVLARLDEVPPMSARDYHTLTARFETLKLILEYLAHRSIALGREPRELGLDDYLRVLTAK